MSQDDFYKKLSKRLGIALAVSGILNIGLLAFGLYDWQEGGFSYLVTCPFKPQKAKLYRQDGKELATLTQALREIEEGDFSASLTLLDDDVAVADGYKRCDLALSLLVQKHFFDIERAIGGLPSARRLFKYMSQANGTTEIVLFPGITKEQFQRCKEFAGSERWPFTAEGLHTMLKTQQEEASLKTAFMQTDEFRVVDLLLRRGSQVKTEEVFELVRKSDWQPIKTLFAEMSKAQDFSPEVRRSFLVKTLPHSANLLVQIEPRFALHSLKDEETLALLATLEKEHVKEYCLGLLELPRSQTVWQQATLLLATVNSLDATKETRQSLLQRFGRLQAPKAPAVPKLAAVPPKVATTTKVAAPKIQAQKIQLAKPQASKPAPAIREILYKVQTGDTLWHISKRFGIDVQVIKKHNKLTTDSLKPGSTLRIPQQPKPQTK